MAANPKRELQALAERLTDEEAAATLDYARQLLANRGPDDGLARARRATGRPRAVAEVPSLASIDELRAASWPAEEGVDEAIATIRRWRDEDRRG